MTRQGHIPQSRTGSTRSAATAALAAPAAHARLLLTVEEAGAAIGVGRSLMYELIANGDLQTVRVGRLRRIRPEALQEYVTGLSG
ncbi:MAG: excisionase family DNA-binding protein [Sporichthyaceae bacterium]